MLDENSPESSLTNYDWITENAYHGIWKQGLLKFRLIHILHLIT